MSIHLFKHNQEAYNSVTAMLEREKMAAVIHPTGTGKSLIAFKLAEEHPSEKFLWLSPSEYIYQTQLENLGMEFDNIQFMSYSRLMKNEDSIETLHPDYIILDEFHRCGAAEWGKSVRKLLTACPDAKRLGLSATNIRYLDNQRNMAEEIFDGKIASEMTLGEAIVRGILPEPKYVIAMYSYKKELDQLKKRIQALSNQGLITENQKLLEQLRRALEQAEGLDIVFEKHMEKKNGKYIVFCSGKEHMDEMKNQVCAWFQRVDRKPKIYTAFYNDTSTEREFAAFKSDNSDHLKLLFCINMLNEGVHVDDVDGVILLRPTVSPIIWEGFGLVLPEYMMAGKPIVASRVDAIPSIIEDGENGLLVEVDDAAGASKAVLQIHKNNELREKLIVHGLQDVYDKFNVRRVAAEHGELFEKEIKRRI